MKDVRFTPLPGFEVTSLAVPDAPFVHMTLTLRKGLSSEQGGQFGYFSLLSTLLTRGAGGLSRREFAQDCDRRGANVSVYPGRDHLTLELWVLPEDLAWGLTTLERMVWHTGMADEEIELAREEQIQQLEARCDEKRARLFDATRKALFEKSHHYSRSLLGEVSCLRSIEPKSIRAYHRSFLNDISAVLCVTGRFDQDNLETLVVGHFRGVSFQLPSGNNEPVNLVFRPGESVNESFPVEQAHVVVVLPALSRCHKDYRLAHFCNEILGGAFLSRLTRAVRMREGMAYSADSRLRAGVESGLIWVGLQTDREKVAEALKTVRVCMDELRTEGVQADEFRHFVDFVTSSMPFDYDALSSLTSRRLEERLFGESWELDARMRNLAQTVTLERTNEMFRTLLQPEGALVAALGQDLATDYAQAFHEVKGPRVASSVLSLFQGPRSPAPSERYRKLSSHSQGDLYCLSCGIKLLVLPRTELASISLQVWTLTGSMDEVKGRTGLSHLLEHMMFRGTSNFPDGSFDAILAQRGGLNNAFTSEDFTVYTDYVTLDGLEEALLLEADRFRNLDTTEEIFQTEREVVLEERSVNVDCSPLGKAYEAIQSLSLGDHPYGHPVIGWREDLEQTTLQDIQSHYERATRPERLMLVIAGGCPTERAVTLAERCFSCSDIPTETSQPPLWPVLPARVTVPLLRAESAELKERSGYSYLLLCYRFPREGHPDFAACELLVRMVVEGDSSRLHETFVRDRRRVLEVWSSYEPQTRDHPLLHLGLATPGGIDGSKLPGEVGEYLEHLSPQLTEEELDKVKRCWRAEEAFGTDELEDWALDIAGRVMLMPWEDVWTYEERILAVTLDDVRRVASRYFQQENMVHLVLHGESSD